ncbi:hypothetical protein [Coralloluteibacterium stylophorae]|uniref:Uncharacterized protein n=1 Tax=Coralloluteibacterium stylophorae TaxID=1776034 RepID=A0A8J7VTA8_9GAMM|nr:hypothetical protein [Coralloluteibacterium stylophorae]MBS7455744.1 hypothetical protein [Coralloluteibacterium stylophorae]
MTPSPNGPIPPSDMDPRSNDPIPGPHPGRQHSDGIEEDETEREEGIRHGHLPPK